MPFKLIKIFINEHPFISLIVWLAVWMILIFGEVYHGRRDEKETRGTDTTGDSEK